MMKNEFYEAYSQLFENSYNNLRRTIRIKLKAIRYCNRHAKVTNVKPVTTAQTIFRMSVHR